MSHAVIFKFANQCEDVNGNVWWCLYKIQTLFNEALFCYMHLQSTRVLNICTKKFHIRKYNFGSRTWCFDQYFFFFFFHVFDVTFTSPCSLEHPPPPRSPVNPFYIVKLGFSGVYINSSLSLFSVIFNGSFVLNLMYLAFCLRYMYLNSKIHQIYTG